MAHYLKTINPEAAERSEQVRLPDTGLPHPGHIVRFFPRSGDAPGNLTQFALYVTKVNPLKATIDGLCIFDSRDMRDMNNVPYDAAHEPYSWDWMDGVAPVGHEPEAGLADIQVLVQRLTITVTDQAEQILRLREDIRALGGPNDAKVPPKRREPATA